MSGLLWDPHSNAMLSLSGDFNFFAYIRNRTTPKGMSRAKLETLRDRIQESLLLDNIDPSFPKYHQRDEISTDQRNALVSWDRKFKIFLSHSDCSQFKIL